MEYIEYKAPPYRLRVNNFFWTSVTDHRYISGLNSVYYDTLKSASDFDKSYDAIFVVFVRNGVEADKKTFNAALSYVKCDSRSLSDRKSAQVKYDEESAIRGQKWRASIFGGGSSNSNSTAEWAILSEENGGGLAHWYTKKFNAKCTSGRKSGERITIHLLKSSGKYQEVSGSVKNSLAEAARDACS